MNLATSRRPYDFSAVVEQQNAVATLQGSLLAPSAGSYMIHGPYGTGKTTLARIFARRLNCLNPQTCTRETPCNSCQAFLEDNHPDIVEQNGAEARGIDDVRKLLSVAAVYPSTNFRVIIIDEAQQLTQQAQSALLKQIEEPHKRTIWILATTEPSKLLPTIVSRTMQIPLTLLSDAGIEQTILRAAEAERVHVPPQIVAAIVESAAGHARDALSLLTTYTKSLSMGGSHDVQKLAAKIQASSPLVLAFSYVQGLLGGHAERVFTAPAMAEDKGRFLMDVVEVLRGLMYKASGSTTLVSTHPYAERISKAPVDITHLRIVAYLFEIHVQALVQLRKYEIPEKDLVDSVAAKALVAVKS
jgi:DNA polymerase-3 subunit gamma/tau